MTFNTAQSYAHAGDLGRAAEYYTRFLSSSPGGAERKEALEKLATIALLTTGNIPDRSQAFLDSLAASRKNEVTLPAPVVTLPPLANEPSKPALLAHEEVLVTQPKHSSRWKVGVGLGVTAVIVVGVGAALAATLARPAQSSSGAQGTVLDGTVPF